MWGNGEVRRRDFFVWGKEEGAELERGRRGFFRGGEEEEREGAGGEVRWGTVSEFCWGCELLYFCC